MKSPALIVAIATAALTICSPAFAGAVASDSSNHSGTGLVLPSKTDGSRMTLSVDIGEHGPFDFLIDTGAETTVVSDQLALYLGLDDDGTVRVHSFGGSALKPVVWIDEMVLGPLKIDKRRAVVMLETDIGASGIIGIDSLKDQRVVLDFGRGSVTVSPSEGKLDRAGHDVTVRAKEKGNRLVIHNARLDGIGVDLVIDTGLNITVGNSALRRKLGPESFAALKTTIADANGNFVPSEIKVARQLWIDTLRLSNPMIAFADTDVFEKLGLGDRPALLLGMDHLRMFSSVAVDFHRRQIAFNLYRPTG